MRAVSLKSAEFAMLSAEILDHDGSLCFEAHGHSMSPFIRDGDVLTVQAVTTDALRVGDVALYCRAGHRLAVHRVASRRVRGERAVLRMRGDAVVDTAERVPAQQVLGRVVRVQRGPRVIHLDRKVHRLMARLWIGLSLLRIPWCVQTVRCAALSLLRRLLVVKTYRAAARKLIGKRVRYRISTVGDASDLAALYGCDRFPELGDGVASFAGQMESLQGCGHTLIARVGERIAGAAVIRQFPGNATFPSWWLFGMFVRMRYRGAGIGEGLVRLALEEAAAEGAHQINLLVFEQNGAAINLYRKMGFRSASIPGLDEQLAEEVRRGEQHRIIMSRPSLAPGGRADVSQVTASRHTR
jgi:GNAT superfamily N-acetyltransferase